MNVGMYNRANNYAWVLNSADKGTQTNKDVLHDAYLSWYDKTGNNLFDEPPFRVFRVIKITFLKSLQKNHKFWFFNNEKFKTTFYEWNEWEFNNNKVTPEDEYILSEVKKNCQEKVNKLVEISSSRTKGVNKTKLGDAYSLFVDGYSPAEIAKKLHITKRGINKYSNQIKNGTITAKKEYPSR